MNDAGSAIESGYARLLAGPGDEERVAAAAALILAIFDEFYLRLCEYPYRAKNAFETMDPHASIEVSRDRLGLYSRTTAEHGPRIAAAFPALASHPALWERLEARFVAMIVDLYQADIAFSFAHSIRRNICKELWRPVAYSFPPPSKRRAMSMASVHRRLPIAGGIDAALIASALQAPYFSRPFRDLSGDAERIRARFEAIFREEEGGVQPTALDVVEAGFFRDRTAVVVGRWVMPFGGYRPFVVALLNSPAGIYADAVLHRVSDIHNIFSSALANFHVTTRLYYQTCVFLFTIMPRRPLGHQYSTIGFNHVGKVAILEEIVLQMRASGQRFERSPGFPGTVALGFTFDACTYHLKIIRDRPTRDYKWGEFPGAAAVIEKYRVVHEINRAGSMLDNVMYFNFRLDREMFDPGLLDEICEQAAGSVHVDDDGVFIRSLIVQLKIIPLPVYLDSAGPEETRNVIANLGRCIRDNAATNIFNKDLDSRNYGVGRYGRVFLFDYDALEELTEVKIRTNADREPGEDSVPGWFFENGVIFLPEELESGLRLRSAFARRCFRTENPELLDLRYWMDVQRKLIDGEVPELSTYPENCRLDPGADPAADPAANPTPGATGGDPDRRA